MDRKTIAEALGSLHDATSRLDRINSMIDLITDNEDMDRRLYDLLILIQSEVAESIKSLDLVADDIVGCSKAS